MERSFASLTLAQLQIRLGVVTLKQYPAAPEKDSSKETVMAGNTCKGLQIQIITKNSFNTRQQFGRPAGS